MKNKTYEITISAVLKIQEILIGPFGFKAIESLCCEHRKGLTSLLRYVLLQEFDKGNYSANRVHLRVGYLVFHRINPSVE